MAGVIVGVVMEEILRKLNSIAAQDIGPASSSKGEVQKLQSSLSSIQAVLEDAEMRQAKEESVRDWLKRLKDVACYAEDVLDEVATELVQRKMETKKQVCNFSLPFKNPFAFSANKMAHNKIKDVNKKLDGITKDKYRFQFREGRTVVNTEQESLESSREDQKTYPIDIHYSEVRGRDTELDAVLTNLERAKFERRAPVFSIVGQGGLGKTTFARLVYNESSVNEFFDVKTWVWVSDDFDVKRVLIEMLESATGTPCYLFNFDAIVKELRNILKLRSFLLVLDDVMDKDMEKCQSLKTVLDGVLEYNYFPGIILVTTTSDSFAKNIGAYFTLHLKALSDIDDSWSIFKEQAFREGEIENIENLEKIGKEMVRKCGGLPLQVKMLGGLIRSRREENQWMSVRDSEIWNDQNSKIHPAIRLSYEHLPSHLKQCFAYCSIFPKNHKIKKDMLIQLWMAQGFVPTIFQGNGLSLDDIANQYFNILLSMSFFQEEKDKYGDLIACKMPDMVHDLAKFVDGNECSVVEADKVEGVHERSRHLSFSYNKREQTYQNELQITKESSLHTFVVFGNHYLTISHEMVLCFNYLRVLDLSIFNLDKLSPSIGKLKHLRYLDLSFTGIENLPNSITHLHNLQTLKLVSCCSILELPKGITNMINLRHLQINTNGISMPKNLGKLTNLQTLPIFPVHKDSQCGFGELGCLQYLRGDLEISFLENFRNREEASKAKLKDKQNLRRLRLSWIREEVDDDTYADVMEGLQPPPHLEALEIFRFPGKRIPSWMIMVGGGDGDLQQEEQQQLPSLMSTRSLLSSLKFLRIKSCANLQSLSNMGGFPCLKFLIISDCKNLTSIPDQEMGNLLSLSSLSIQNCPKLTSLPAAIQGLKLLQELDIFGCPALRKRCEMNEGEDWPKIAHIPRIVLNGYLFGLTAYSRLYKRSQWRLRQVTGAEVRGGRHGYIGS